MVTQVNTPNLVMIHIPRHILVPFCAWFTQLNTFSSSIHFPENYKIEHLRLGTFMQVYTLNVYLYTLEGS